MDAGLAHRTKGLRGAKGRPLVPGNGTARSGRGSKGTQNPSYTILLYNSCLPESY